ncbi:CDGSH iron-sulfur domain-containing protein NEET [Linum perenne]
MASISTSVTATFIHANPSRINRPNHSPSSSAAVAAVPIRSRRIVSVRAEAQAINPEIRKSEEKVVDSVEVVTLSKPLTAYCRCWRSQTFPLCDGSHVKHNKATGDNVGPLLLKKPKE